MTIFVKSVEYVEINVLGTEIDVSSNLTKGQDYRNCVPFMTSHSGSDNLDSKLFDMYFSGTFINGIINFSRSNLRAATATIKCYIVEFYPTEVRVQQGTFDVSSATTHTVTLPTTLNSTNKAAITFGWKNSSTSQLFNSLVVRGRVTATTSIDFYRNNTSNNCTGHWFLFEDLNDNFNVTHKNSSYTGTSQTLTIDDGRCVDPLRTFLIGSYATSSAHTYNSWNTARIYLYSNGSVCSDRAGTSYNIYWNCQVVEFLDQEKIFVPFDHYLSSFSTTTLTRVVGTDVDKVPFVCDMDYSMATSAMAQGISRSAENGVVYTNETFISVELTAGTTINYEKDGASSSNYPSYTTAVDWRGIIVNTGTNASPIPEGSGPGESFVKSVENFRFTLNDYFGARVLSKGQDWTNCAIFSSSKGSGGYNINDNMVNVYMVSPGIVCYKTWSTSDQIIDISVVEFWPDQVKVQHQNRYLKKTSTTTTDIEEVSDTKKCFVTSSNFVSGATGKYSLTMVRTGFSDTTTLAFYQVTPSYETDVSFFIVEDLQDNFDTLHFSDTMTGSTQNIYDDTYNWEASNTFTLTSYASDASYHAAYGGIRSYYVGEFKPTLINRKNTSGNIYYYTTIVKFKQNNRHIQHLNRSFSATIYTGEYSTTFSGHSDALTCFNTVQQSCIRADTTTAAAIADAFGTIRITDYETRTYEQSKAAHTINSYGSFTMIDWIGEYTQKEQPLIPTRAVVNSVQIVTDNSTSGYIAVPLTKGQNIKQCVPFLASSPVASDYESVRFYRTVYRYEDPDYFVIRFGSSSTGDRKTTCYITEFGSDIKVQHDEGYADGTTKTFTIDEVNLNRAFLVFYGYSDSWDNSIRDQAICGHFNSSTEIEFIRTYTGEQMCVSWYIVECPDDDSYWKVQHIYETSKGTLKSVEIAIPSRVDNNRTMYLSSWTIGGTGAYAGYNFYRMRRRVHGPITFDKNYANNTMDNVNIEAIEMSKELAAKGFKSIGNFITLNGATTTVDSSLNLDTEDYFDLNRSMVISGNQGNECRCDTTAYAGFDEGFHYYSFKDNNTVTAVKTGGGSYNTYSYYFAYQWPEFNKYYMEGTIVESDNVNPPVLVDREVLAYRSSTNELVEKTTSSGGYFFIETPYPDDHYIVCRDDDAGLDYNHLIYGRMQPAVISGTFAYNEGLVTISGMDVGVPLGRL